MLSYVNQVLTIQPTGDSRPDKPRRRDVVENDEYAAFVRRIIRAFARRIADGDVEALRHMADLSDLLDEAMTDAVTGLHAYGYSWAEIGRRLPGIDPKTGEKRIGISRQAAQQRFGGDQ
jgi:hypothetical protein